MSHDVFLCYSNEDKSLTNRICHGLEENKIRCWFKSRDFKNNPDVRLISEAIENSKCVVLVYSEHVKNSNDVASEIDIAFSKNVPILVYKIDDSSKRSGLDFFLMNKPWFDNYKNPSKNFKNLVKEISIIIRKPINEIKVPKDFKINNTLFKKIAIAGISVIIVAILLVSATSVFYHTTDDGEFSIIISDVDISEGDPSLGEKNFVYDIYLQMTNAPENNDDYSMEITVYDTSNNVLDKQKTKLGITCSGEFDKNDANLIVVNVLDSNQNLIASSNYTVSGHNI